MIFSQSEWKEQLIDEQVSRAWLGLVFEGGRGRSELGYNVEREERDPEPPLVPFLYPFLRPLSLVDGECPDTLPITFHEPRSDFMEAYLLDVLAPIT